MKFLFEGCGLALPFYTSFLGLIAFADNPADFFPL
jgi:hypothetical protein